MEVDADKLPLDLLAYHPKYQDKWKVRLYQEYSLASSKTKGASSQLKHASSEADLKDKLEQYDLSAFGLSNEKCGEDVDDIGPVALDGNEKCGFSNWPHEIVEGSSAFVHPFICLACLSVGACTATVSILVSVSESARVYVLCLCSWQGITYTHPLTDSYTHAQTDKHAYQHPHPHTHPDKTHRTFT